MNSETFTADTEYIRTEWKSHTMRAFDASLTPGTLSNAVLVTAVSLALKNHRIYLMAAGAAISQLSELREKICENQ
ncbi:MAG: hypothetical protein PHV39_05440 [Methanomicrobium sp.]|nr:hypothetical protein [Methanomicrobium sp.]